jgi:hypothetical protein
MRKMENTIDVSALGKDLKKFDTPAWRLVRWLNSHHLKILGHILKVYIA